MGGRLGEGRTALPEPQPDEPIVEVKELVGDYMMVRIGCDTVASAVLRRVAKTGRACLPSRVASRTPAS